MSGTYFNFPHLDPFAPEPDEFVYVSPRQWGKTAAAEELRTRYGLDAAYESIKNMRGTEYSTARDRILKEAAEQMRKTMDDNVSAAFEEAIIGAEKNRPQNPRPITEPVKREGTVTVKTKKDGSYTVTVVKPVIDLLPSEYRRA